MCLLLLSCAICPLQGTHLSRDRAGIGNLPVFFLNHSMNIPSMIKNFRNVQYMHPLRKRISEIVNCFEIYNFAALGARLKSERSNPISKFRTSRRISGQTSGVKTFGQAFKIREKKTTFWRGHPRSEGADVHDLARVQKKHWSEHFVVQ